MIIVGAEDGSAQHFVLKFIIFDCVVLWSYNKLPLVELENAYCNNA
jgi:hypothetical protein